MDPRLLRAAATGNTSALDSLLAQNPAIINGVTSPAQDTALHIALRQGHLGFARHALALPSCPPSFLAQPNALGDTPLHCALAGGKPEFVVHCLRRRLMSTTNFPAVNQAGKSLVYLAAERGFVDAVKSLLRSSPLGADIGGLEGSTALHAAALLTSDDTLSVILQHHRNLKHTADGKGNTPLHYAAMAGNLWAFHQLIDGDNDASSIETTNNDGFTPLHLTVMLGNLRAFECLLKRFPDAVWVPTGNAKKENVLHLAVEEGKTNVARFIASRPELWGLMYEADEEGKTPLHLAARKSDGMLCIFMEAGIVFPSVKNWGNVITVADIAKKLSVETKERKREEIRESRKKRENLVSSLLVVAGLIITVTFTAAFTMPGGYKQDGDHVGTAVLAKRLGFRIFLILDTISMCSAITAAAALILFSLNSSRYQQIRILQLAALEIGISIVSMLVAFAAGACVVTGPLSFWLAFVVALAILCAPLFCFVVVSEIMLGPEVEDMVFDDMSRGELRVTDKGCFECKFWKRSK